MDIRYGSNSNGQLYGGKRYGSPRQSNYEKDVAVFKGKEQTSQMSSSTDSGYVHNTLDRLSNDLKFSGTVYCFCSLIFIS